MFDMIRQAQALKEKMAQFQKEMEGQSFTGSSGAVTVTMNGKHEIQKVEIDNASPVETERLQVLIREAVNAAGRQVNAKLKAEMSKMTGGLLPPGIF